MKKVLIGIDGGGSNTNLLVTDFELNKIYEAAGGATNFHKIGLEEAVLNVQNLVESYFTKFNEDAKIALVLGTAGAGRKSDAEHLETYLQESLPDIDSIKVVSDAEITFRGAFENENGAILIAGTGSILYYKTNGEINRVGGFGRIIGDEGSGYSIGRKGLNYLSKMLDGRIRKTTLEEIASQKFGIEKGSDLITKVYKEDFDVAGFAETVIEAAEKGEEYSSKIIEEETNELVNHFEVLKNNKDIDEIKLVMNGGLVQKDNFFKRKLIEKLESEIPQIKIVNPKYKPEYGAVLIAKEILQENK